MPRVSVRSAGDAYVVALGSYSPALLSGVGVDALVYPPKATAPRCPARRQQDSGTEGQHHRRREEVVFTTIGERLRIAGTAELNGFDTSLNTVRCEALTRRAKHHFLISAVGQGGILDGLRPATPPTCPSSGSRS